MTVIAVSVVKEQGCRLQEAASSVTREAKHPSPLPEKEEGLAVSHHTALSLKLSQRVLDLKIPET